jgi:ER degradation enhancer, mannosidase alpha-like 2
MSVKPILASLATKHTGRTLVFGIWLVILAAFAGHGCNRSREELQARRLAALVKSEFLHAWRNYERYAWGHDALRPLTKTPHDWYEQSLLITPVDALDTLVLMDLDAEVAKAKELIVRDLSFDRDIYVKNFEVTIRLLGGLLSGYQLTDDQRLLQLAEDLGNRLLPVFNSPTGLPYVYVNLGTGQVRDPVTNPAETGTLLLEFGTLSKLTGRPEFYDKAKRALVETYKRRSPLGLVGQSINVETGAWIDTDSHISGGIDSYYEYLWKCWLLFGDKECRAMWNASLPAVNKYLADDTGAELWYGHANMQTGKRTETTYGALDTFFPALLALSGDFSRARRLQTSSFRMWNLHGIEPEVLDYKTMRVISGAYHLRPEIVESTYYLYLFTHEADYRRMGEKLFNDFVKYCRADAGYAALADVVTKQKRDEMESFALAETFKYFYLLFAPPKTLDFDKIVFNTEAHPLRRTW